MGYAPQFLHTTLMRPIFSLAYFLRCFDVTARKSDDFASSSNRSAVQLATLGDLFIEFGWSARQICMRCC